ncbi:nuclear transport factor 2 family protein [Streptomyces sp. NPDC056796]|uniref:nuclear transport factor 2 family protein n=1 Tax=Streptomyces sp. NPDC056796 TaxID=3345947 RepID=UPI003692CEAB
MSSTEQSPPDTGQTRSPADTRRALAGSRAALARLERRLNRLEDEAAVTSLILSYGPLVDSGSARAVADLWVEDGVYDVDELLMTGRAEIEAMVHSPGHQRWISQGCAHVVGAPRVRVDGDEAVAVCYTTMIVRDPEAGAFVVRRATANHWRLRRGPDGWRVTVRTNRVLDGRAESPALLASGGSPALLAPGVPDGRRRAGGEGVREGAEGPAGGLPWQVEDAAGPAEGPVAGAGGSRPSGAADDHRLITEALARLASALDHRDWEGVAAAFAPDATGYGATGVAQIVDVVRRHLGGCGPSQHLLGNHRVSVDGDRARSLTYARVHHQGAGSWADRFFECCGEYDDHWSRTGGQWLLSRREFTVTLRLGDRGVLRPPPGPEG